MTPNNTDGYVGKLIKRLNASHEPTRLLIEPEAGAEEKECFPIIQEKVKTSGGRMILGWLIWDSGYLVEAEFHAVWEDENEQLHDLTPQIEGIKEVMFVEDENLVYNEKQVDNRRLNTTSNPLVDDLIEVCKAIYKFDNKGERAYLYDLSTVLNEKQIAHKLYLARMKEIINAILSAGGSRNTACPCGLQTPFRDCHGKHFKERVARDV